MDLALFVMFDKFMTFIRMLNRGNFIFQVFMEVIINFSSISLKLCLLGQKTQRNMGCEYHYSKTSSDILKWHSTAYFFFVKYPTSFHHLREVQSKN